MCRESVSGRGRRERLVTNDCKDILCHKARKNLITNLSMQIHALIENTGKSIHRIQKKILKDALSEKIIAEL